MKLHGRSIYPGAAQAVSLVTNMGISFFGGVDPDTGIVMEKGHELEGLSVAGKVLVFPSGKGSTVGSYTLYRMSKNGVAPAAIINTQCEAITAVGCILGELPCIDQVDISEIASGMTLRVDGTLGEIEILKGPTHLAKG